MICNEIGWQHCKKLRKKKDCPDGVKHQYGLKINEKKIVVMKMSRNRRAKMKVILNGKHLKEVTSVYLFRKLNIE